jgi:L-alanine-DL-glutamate epimerase-like enolase superfamily enzyme
MLSLTVEAVRWPLKVPFTISRETIDWIDCIMVTLVDAAGNRGRGEAVGVDYAGETVATMTAQLEAVRGAIEAGVGLAAAQALLPAGGARNALDCALWDLAAKATGVRAFAAAGLAGLVPKPTAFTFGIMDEAALRAAARDHVDFALLKVKTDRDHGLDPVRIVHEEAPGARLIVDPNASWGAAELTRVAPHLEGLNVALLEQPVHPESDEMLRSIKPPVPVAADEAFGDRGDIAGLVGKYSHLNMKLDKTGGLTEALACVAAGQAAGFGLMVGCMVGSSLSMAPGVIVAQHCAFVDLDGPLLQAADVADSIGYKGGLVGVPAAALWG